MCMAVIVIHEGYGGDYLLKIFCGQDLDCVWLEELFYF